MKMLKIKFRDREKRKYTRKKKVLREFTARIRNLFENEILERALGGGDDA